MKTMCGGLFSFCFLHETVFGNGNIAISANVSGINDGRHITGKLNEETGTNF